MTRRFWPIVSLVLALALAAVVVARPSAAQSDAAVITGSDIGFRVDYYQGRHPVGTLVVKVNGQWIEPKTAPSMMLLTPVR